MVEKSTKKRMYQDLLNQVVEERLPHVPFAPGGAYLFPLEEKGQNPPPQVPFTLRKYSRPRSEGKQFGYKLQLPVPQHGGKPREKIYQFKGKRALKFLFENFSTEEILGYPAQELVEFLNYPELLLTACLAKGPENAYRIFLHIWNAGMNTEGQELEEKKESHAKTLSRSGVPSLSESRSVTQYRSPSQSPLGIPFRSRSFSRSRSRSLSSRSRSR